MSIGSRGAAAGGAGTAILVLVLIGIAILALGTWLWTQRSPLERAGPVPAAAPSAGRTPRAEEEGAAGPAPEAGSGGPSSSGGSGLSGAPAASDAADAGRAPAPPPPRRTGSEDGNRFAGRGRLRGSISAPGEETLPQAWTLVVRPGPMVPGHEHAETRELELGAADAEFDVSDLPLGGYEVTARAPGRNCRAVPVVLERSHREAVVALLFTPAGFLEGFVQEEGGAPLDGLRVELEPVAGGARRETRTDANGGYRFDAVLDGAYRLHFGSAEPPVLPPRSLTFSAPSMRFPTTTAPKLARLELFVLAAGGGPVPAARVLLEGPTGRVALETDASGRATALLVRPGPHRVAVEAEGYAPAVEELSFAEGESAEAEVELRPE